MASEQKSSRSEIYFVIEDDSSLHPLDNEEPAQPLDNEEDEGIEWVMDEGTKYQETSDSGASESVRKRTENTQTDRSLTVSEKVVHVRKESVHSRKRVLQVKNVSPSKPSTSSAGAHSINVPVPIDDGDSEDGAASQPMKDVKDELPLGDEIPLKTRRLPPSIVWPDEAVEKLLKLLEAAYPHMSSMPPNKRAELWHCVELDMKPFVYSGMECHIKFQKLKTTYKKLRSENPKDRRHWKHYDAVARVLGDFSDDGEMKGTETKKSSIEAVSSRLKTDDASLSRFDELIKVKKDILAEVRRHGEIIRQHINETEEFGARRERQELDTLELLKSIQEQEKTKLKFLGALLDKL